MKFYELEILESLLKRAEDTDEFVIYSKEAEGPINIKNIKLVDDGKEYPFVVVTVN